MPTQEELVQPVQPKNPAKNYWTSLTENFSSQSKIWLEGFDIPKDRKPEVAAIISTGKIKLSNVLAAKIQTASHTQDIPFTSFFYCAFGLLINRLSGSDDILFGTFLEAGNCLLPVRSHPETEETLQIFLKKMTAQLANSTRQAGKFDSKYCDEAFGRYLVLFTDNDETTQLNPEDHPLVLRITASSETFEMNFYCHAGKFTTESVTSLAEHFLLILEKLVEVPEQSPTHFSILTPEEKIKLEQFSQSAVTTPPENQPVYMHTLFGQRANKFPSHLAISWQDRQVSYSELDQLANQIAHFLLHKKVRPGDNIAVLMERTPLLMAIMIGIFRAGAIFVPLNTKYPDERIQFILDDCQTHLILASHTHRIAEEQLYKTALIAENSPEIRNFPTTPPIVREKEDPIACIVYTSGTTGQPKGIPLRHSSLINHLNWYKTCFHITESDRASQFASQGFDAFFCETIPFLAIGASVHIVDDDIKLTPSLFLPWLARQKITICDLPTAYAQILLGHALPDTLLLKTLKMGGEALTVYPQRKFPFTIWNIYGPAEAAIESTYIKIFSANTEPTDQSCKHFPPPIGKPIPNVCCYVVDSHLELVPPGCAGELLIGGAGLSPGYLNRQQLTREKFIPNIFRKSGDSESDKLFRTGDLVRWLPDGNLEFIGRVDHQIKIRGYRIGLGEIETALGQYPDVSEVIVLARELPDGQKSLVAWLAPNLERIRIPWQERCMASVNNTEFAQIFTEDISREGVAITGVPESFQANLSVRLQLKLPGASDSEWFTGKIIWQHERRAGIHFDPVARQKKLLEKSIEYYLATHNLMETLQSVAAKRSLRKALKNKLPEYMIPAIFSILPRLPLTFNGKIDWKALPPPQDFEHMLERSYVAPRTETEQIVANFWSEILGQSRIGMTDNFFDLGGNSLKVAELSIRIMKKFNIIIPAKIFFDLPFIPVMSEFIDSGGKKYTDTSPVQDEISRDAILNDDIVPHKILHTRLNKKSQGILLTDATGFHGLFLLRELVAQTDTKIYCLVRRGNFESIASRLNHQIEQYQLSDSLTLSSRRIVLIDGDTGLHQFGLSSELYENLVRHVDRIYHCAAEVNTMASYTTARTRNVLGTLEVIRFAIQQIDRPIYYVSTLGAASARDENGNFAEIWPPAIPEGLTGGYALSTWVCERLLLQARQRGLPVQIYRSGYIFGEAETGITSLNDALLLLIKGCLQLGFAPDWHEIVGLLPVDFVSRAIVGISLSEPDNSAVYHLDHPKGILWTDLIAWFGQHNHPMQLCPHAEWLKKLANAGPDNALYPLMPHYLAMKNPPETPFTAMGNAQAKIQKIGMHYPEISDALLQTWLNYIEQAGFFTSVKKTISV